MSLRTKRQWKLYFIWMYWEQKIFEPFRANWSGTSGQGLGIKLTTQLCRNKRKSDSSWINLLCYFTNWCQSNLWVYLMKKHWLNIWQPKSKKIRNYQRYKKSEKQRFKQTEGNWESIINWIIALCCIFDPLIKVFMEKFL